MKQTAEQLLEWLAKEVPALKERLAASHAAVEEAQRRLRAECGKTPDASEGSCQ